MLNYNIDEYGTLHIYVNGMLQATIQDCENMTKCEIQELINEVIFEAKQSL